MSESEWSLCHPAGLQKRLAALPPTLRSMKTDYASLRSQVRNFSDFYGAAVAEAKKQVRGTSLSALPAAAVDVTMNLAALCR